MVSAFMLMGGKSEKIYVRKVRENVEITCESAMCDFDMRSINSLMLVNPSKFLTGCFFHARLCIWRRIKSGRQSTSYIDNGTARSIFLRCLRFLPFFKKIILIMRRKH
ncbi:hypothetical protein HZS_3357 [Henneguya salminicola]|nr:hypothetical protein HZS_3357 [Henneguya salminicola]